MYQRSAVEIVYFYTEKEAGSGSCFLATDGPVCPCVALSIEDHLSLLVSRQARDRLAQSQCRDPSANPWRI